MSHISGDLSPISSGIDSISPFPLLEDDNSGVETPTINDEDDALHMKSAPRCNTSHPTIRTSLSPDASSPKTEPETESSADAKDATAGPILSPSIEIQEGSDAEFQSQYYLENESFEDVEGEALDSTEEFNDEDDEISDDDNDAEDHDDEEDNNGVNMHRRFMQSTSSLSGPNAFAPPFYNRPPTPLPPSPSLTSLLRPPFSTTTSRPTTPDTSDAETPNDTEATVAKSARIATTVPRASPKVPTYEYYGFVLYLTSSLAFCKLNAPSKLCFD
jgi:phosphatidylinositol N-acetylglucosaminyltransferase subunit P